MTKRSALSGQAPTIVVTASSFMKEAALCRALEQAFPRASVLYFNPDSIKTQTEWIECLQAADAWLLGREAVTDTLLKALPRLRVVAKYGVGLDNVDQIACHAQGVALAWEAGVNREAVAEHTLGLMLSLTRNIATNARHLAGGRWIKNGGVNLSGQKVGIVGLGHVGTRVAELLKAFRCEVRFCDRLDKSSEAAALGLRQITYPQLLAWSDMITFHVPLTEETRGMLDGRALQTTRSGVRIINTSRGQVICEEDLKTYLLSGHVAGAGLDVFESEPWSDKDLTKLDNFVATPHTAGNSREAVWAMGEAAIKGLQKVLG